MCIEVDLNILQILLRDELKKCFNVYHLGIMRIHESIFFGLIQEYLKLHEKLLFIHFFSPTLYILMVD